MKAKDKIFQVKKTLNLRGNLVSLDTPAVMGILNITPDSFYSLGRQNTEKEILSAAENRLVEGALILDIGGYSSRPNAEDISTDIETDRIGKALALIVKEFPEAYIFSERVEKLRILGVKDIILDPGFGFAKTAKQSYEILRNLDYFKGMRLPLLAGLSRKSMIYRTLDISAEEALNGTTALNMAALINGVSLLRVHDVKAAVETVQLYKAIYP